MKTFVFVLISLFSILSVAEEYNVGASSQIISVYQGTRYTATLKSVKTKITLTDDNQGGIQIKAMHMCQVEPAFFEGDIGISTNYDAGKFILVSSGMKLSSLIKDAKAHGIEYKTPDKTSIVISTYRFFSNKGVIDQVLQVSDGCN